MYSFTNAAGATKKNLDMCTILLSSVKTLLIRDTHKFCLWCILYFCKFSMKMNDYITRHDKNTRNPFICNKIKSVNKDHIHSVV